MVLGFRLCSNDYLPLDSTGSKLAGGRWNSKKVPVVYLSESIALAVLEVTVNATDLPDDYKLTEVSIDDTLIESLIIATLPPTWREGAPFPTTRKIGDQWCSEKRSAVLRVPSSVVPQEFNLIVNTEHPDFAKITSRDLGLFEFDSRLRPKKN